MDKKKTIRIIIGVILFLVFGSMYVLYNHSSGGEIVVTEDFSDGELSQRSGKAESTAAALSPSAHTGIYVHICGEIKKPGVYTFEKEPRVIDVVEKAGGFTKKAKQDCVNMAQLVADGTQLFIAGKEKVSQQREQEAKEELDSGKVNINTASKEELMTLSGIGESKAAQILTYRETIGRFAKIEDIKNISGIKDGVFSKIKDYITV